MKYIKSYRVSNYNIEISSYNSIGVNISTPLLYLNNRLSLEAIVGAEYYIYTIAESYKVWYTTTINDVLTDYGSDIGYPEKTEKILKITPGIGMSYQINMSTSLNFYAISTGFGVALGLSL